MLTEHSCCLQYLQILHPPIYFHDDAPFPLHLLLAFFFLPLSMCVKVPQWAAALLPVLLDVGLIKSFVFASCMSPPLPELNPPRSHRLLPLPFRPCLIWIRRLRFNGLPASGQLEVQVILFRLVHIHDEMSFPSDNVLLFLMVLLYSCMLSSTSFISSNLMCFITVSSTLRFQSLQQHD